MIQKRIGRLRLELYNGVDELPIERYHKFNLFCLMSAGIGNDAESVSQHITDIYQSLQKNDIERLKTQFQNYYHGLHLILEKVDTQSLAFSCLVHSWNGNEVTDISDEGLEWLRKKILQAEKRQKILSLFTELKKKLRTR